METTVIQHVLSRLHDIGIKDVFGVAGDFAFPIDDAVSSNRNLRWVGCCNELNAAYAADGYARTHGVAALCTTYGVGELSAICGIGGAYAEHVTVFHLVGMPPSGVQAERRLVHHTLGNGEFELFFRMAEPVVCAQAIMTPENCVAETERLIAAALYHRRPVYMAFPTDYANTPVIGKGVSAVTHASDPAALQAAVNAIVSALSASKTACILPGILIARCGLRKEATAVVDASGLPFATMLMDKCVLDEEHPSYIGMYDGKLMDEQIRAFVEGCDCVLSIGAMLTDFSSGAFTAQIDRSKSINIMHHTVRVGSAVYNNIAMKDVLVALAKKLQRREMRAPKVHGLKPIIFVLNNDGYLIERLLTKDPESYYNDLAQWHYHKLPEALGCDGWFTARVTTCGELDEAIKTAEARGTAAYIEVVTDKYAASPLAKKYHESIETLYAS